jgi:hypothetical protein
MMLSDSLPSTSVIVQQVTSLCSMAVSKENPNSVHESIAVILFTSCQAAQVDSTP